jgi:CheY-like chemotaxis protein
VQPDFVETSPDAQHPGCPDGPAADGQNELHLERDLIQSIAHDLNNLLHAIRGNTSLVLLQAPENSDLRHWAEQIDVASDRAAEITQQLLSFSQKAEAKHAALDLNSVLLEAGQLARRALHPNIHFEIVPYSEPVLVKVDSMRACQALLNLCVNAQDAMPDGGRLTITNTVLQLSEAEAKQRSIDGARDFVCCSVTDSGCGIPPELLPGIFDPLFTTRGKNKATGPGLVIIHRVLQEAGGFLKVDSVPDHGTTFHLYFPRMTPAPEASPERADRELAHGSGRVLVVDDLDVVRAFSQNFLQTVGLTVLVANHGNEALRILEQNGGGVDLLFTDYSMPEMNGIQLIERVAARWPKIQLVLTSGYLDDDAREKLSALKVHVLTKPYEMQDAAELLVRLLPHNEGA